MSHTPAPHMPPQRVSLNFLIVMLLCPPEEHLKSEFSQRDKVQCWRRKRGVGAMVKEEEEEEKIFCTGFLLHQQTFSFSVPLPYPLHLRILSTLSCDHYQTLPGSIKKLQIPISLIYELKQNDTRPYIIIWCIW